MLRKVEKNKKQILMVDDSHLTSAIMSEFLISKGYGVEIVIAGEEAVEFIRTTKNLDLILMDIELAGKMSGIEAAREIQKIQEVPIVFFTANASDEIRREIREVKAYGYLMKGMDRTVMLSTIEMAIQLHEAYERASLYHHIIENQVNEVYIFRQCDYAVLQTNLCARKRTDLIRRCILERDLVKGETKYQIAGKTVTIRLQVKPLPDSGNKDCLQIILDDITEIKSLENELRTLSQTDPLTGAHNRRCFMEAAQKEIDRINHEKDDTICFAMMDIDRFKQVNDQYGHRSGDEVLVRIVELMKRQIGYGDILARWGGEEFVILLNHKNLEQSVATLKEIRHEMDQILFWSKEKVTASFGLAEYKPGDSLDSVISRADDYMYEAKSAGRDCIRGEKQ